MSSTPNEMIDCAKDICTAANSEVQFRTAISRAYYAAYHAARVFHIGLSTPGSVGTASGMHAQLISQLSNPGIGKGNKKYLVSKALGKSLRPLVDARVDSDYKLNETIDKTLADSVLLQASEVVYQAQA